MLEHDGTVTPTPWPTHHFLPTRTPTPIVSVLPTPQPPAEVGGPVQPTAYGGGLTDLFLFGAVLLALTALTLKPSKTHGIL